MTIDSCTKKEYLMKNRAGFGIIENINNEEYLNIVVQNVRAIATKNIRANIPLPSVNGILNNCRGIINYPGEIDTSFASFRVTGAKEELVHCESDTPAVRVTIQGQIVIRSITANECCPPTYIAIPVQVVDEELTHFYSTKDGQPVTDLKNELAYIDGSCMTVQLNCSIYKDTSSACPRYMARIRGNIVDKLWKRDTMWIEGIRPYPANALTFCDSFESDCAAAFTSEPDCGCEG
ncbi:MAG: hypothetical protein IKU54_02575 [Oscillospiraceae bacterium]|nr:hypothetical protein [Oscillospiraceae bacterium]